MKLAEIVHNPRYFHSIVLKSGMYDHAQRQKFIRAVSEHDLLLAAQCKMSSIEPEPEIKDFLLKKAIETVRTSENAKKIGEAVCAVIRLEEILLAKTLLFWLGEYWAGEVFDQIAQMENVPFKEFEELYQQVYSPFNEEDSLFKSIVAFKLDFGDEDKIEYKTVLQMEAEYYYEMLLTLYYKAQELGFSISKEVYNRLINYSPTFEQAENWRNELIIKGINYDEISYWKGENWSKTDAKTLFNEIGNHLTPIDPTNLEQFTLAYESMINHSVTVEDAEILFKKMKAENLKPNEISYLTLINKSQTLEQQKPFYEEFLQKFPFQKGNFRREKNYNFLFTAFFKKVKLKEDWEFVKGEIQRLGLKMDDYTQKFYDTLNGRF